MPDPDAEAPLVHDACTIAEQGDGGVLIWVAVCFCGWCSAEQEDDVVVLPAYAGVVPSVSLCDRSAGRSPRLRGGGPSTPVKKDLVPKFSPPTRGWSQNTALIRLLLGGSPRLRGGGPPTDTADAEVRGGSPRLRGGGPDSVGTSDPILTFSPPTRGWSVDPRDRLVVVVGSPRLRGGGPRFWIMLYGASAYSPPTRGSEDVAAEEFFWVRAPRLRGVMPKKPRRTCERA